MSLITEGYRPIHVSKMGCYHCADCLRRMVYGPFAQFRSASKKRIFEDHMNQEANIYATETNPQIARLASVIASSTSLSTIFRFRIKEKRR